MTAAHKKDDNLPAPLGERRITQLNRIAHRRPPPWQLTTLYGRFTVLFSSYFWSKP